MTDSTTKVQMDAIADATEELNRLLKVGTYSQRLMRLYAVREIVSRLSAEQLLKAAANVNTYFPNGERQAA
jgi:hypothetical protein